jgi:hypothetical protein
VTVSFWNYVASSNVQGLVRIYDVGNTVATDATMPDLPHPFPGAIRTSTGTMVMALMETQAGSRRVMRVT